jgi:outer membrane protein OmpA-like peptidoglycan-associated protein
MKKFAMFIAAAAMVVSASAQQRTTVTANNADDNVYVGINAGAITGFRNYYRIQDGAKQRNNAFTAYTTEVGARVGKNFTTVFGLAFEGNLYFTNHRCCCPFAVSKTWIQGLDLDLFGTANLMNMFSGYKGQPRFFEVIALGGFGWTHAFGTATRYNGVNSKIAFDFAVNLGAKKQWQVYLEPSITYSVLAFGSIAPQPEYENVMHNSEFKYDINKAGFNLKAGVNYKFRTSNNTHNFALEQLRDQAEIDALNAKINAAKAEADAANADVAAKAAKIAELQKALNACMNTPVPPIVKSRAANLQPSVVFGQGKSNVDRSQEANLDMIASYMKHNKDARIKISGYASPEGSKELNQTLSEKRAQACKDILVKRYKIAADRIETEGLGATDKLFDEPEFNRVALFNDITK